MKVSLYYSRKTKRVIQRRLIVRRLNVRTVLPEMEFKFFLWIIDEKAEQPQTSSMTFPFDFPPPLHLDWLPEVIPSDITSIPVDHSGFPLGIQPLRRFVVNPSISWNFHYYSASKFLPRACVVGFSLWQIDAFRSGDDRDIARMEMNRRPANQRIYS